MKEIKFSVKIRATRLVEKLVPEEFVRFCHSADTMESGKSTRKKEWTGGRESYFISEIDGITTLLVNTEVPLEQEKLFNIRLPKALERIKYLAENY